MCKYRFLGGIPANGKLLIYQIMIKVGGFILVCNVFFLLQQRPKIN